MNQLKLTLIVFALLVFFNTASAQDECTTATTLTPGTTCTFSTFDLAGTLTKTIPIPTTCNSANIVDDAWVKFTATGTLSTISYQNTDRDAALWVYSGTCSSLTLINCVDNIVGVGTETITLNTIVGSVYYVRIGRMNGNNNNTMYGSICIKCITPPVNDNANTATLVNSASTCSYSYFTTEMATASSGITNPLCGNYLGGDIWFNVVVPTSKSLSIKTDTGAIKDGAMAIYTGSAGALTLFNCYDDGGGSNGLMPAVNLSCLTPGDTIRIRFWEKGNDVFGTFRLCIVNHVIGNTQTWLGALSSDWTNSSNWSGCAIPDTTKDVIIYNGASTQPSIPDNTTINCRNLTIQSGVTLTIGQNCILNLTGSFVNNGLLVMPATSTIQFQNSSAQTVDGNFTGVNKLGNLNVIKSGGSLTFLQDADINGNLTINSTSTSVNMNGKRIKLSGNFSNTSSSLIVPINSTLEFNGSVNQTYHQGSATLDLQNIIINKSAGTLTLQTNMNVASAGSLTLTNGVVITGANQVNIKNTNTNSIIGANSTSYIQGNLTRSLDGSTGAYQFPLGNTTKGYEAVTINYIGATNVTSINGRFDVWPGTTPMGPASNDCGGANYGLLQLVNSGYWTFNSTPSNGTGNFNMTIASNGQTNTSINAGTTILKSTDNGTTWTLDGNCVIGSNGTLAARTMMTGFGVMAIGQTSSPLPIELLSFNGTAHEKYNLLEWMTATEKNNNYFALEQSRDGITFESIGTVKGAGNSNVPLNYTFKHDNPLNGITYYRLTQTDFDGTSTKSSIIAINRKGGACIVNAYPNPSSGNCEINIETAYKGSYTVYVNDITGKELYRQNIIIDKEEFKHNFNLSDYKCGMYNCILENEVTKERVNLRLIRQ